MNPSSDPTGEWIDPPANASALEVERFLAAVGVRAGNPSSAEPDPLDRFPPLD